MKNYTKKYNSTHHQRHIILMALREEGSQGLSTIQLREDYDVMMPAARVHELRHGQGFNIQLIWNREINAQGNAHTCGRYILQPGKWQDVAA